MNKVLAVLSVLVVIYLIVSSVIHSYQDHIKSRYAVSAQEETERVQGFQEKADAICKNIYYIKDMRTGLCYTYLNAAAASRDAHLTTVPCETIPPHLLTVLK